MSNTEKNVFTDQNLFIQSVIFTQTTSDGDSFLHTHPFYEFFYIVSGEITHIYKGSVREKLRAGDLCLITPGYKHKFLRDKNTQCVHRDILITEEFFNTCCSFISESAITLPPDPNSSLICHLSFAELENFESELNNYALYRTRQHNDNCYEKFICMDLLKHICKCTLNNSSSYPIWLQQLITRFSFTDILRLGIPKIIESIHYTKPYICRTFKKYTGMTMTDYLLRERLLYSTILLQSTDYTITEIVFEIGISSNAYFNKQFKKYFGVTPSQYRVNQSTKND